MKKNQKPNNKTKNKIITVLTILICSFFAISSIVAINNYFSRQKQEKIKLEQNNFVEAPNPNLTLVLDYELVDKDGNAFSGGSTTIENKITQLA
ncbi:hypothetical protein [Candidatus Phytoplasma australiense]|uniref:Uncharacterized protein n=1 Tax=Strawberry lethal yellows phytoplasma (CPA) str. NZSb11 TaxID=980422 RepID=R4RYN8_PHYAS|nr:hypothetical protein [Candidatus Phytoplasma australiense]AGL91002.1 Hypothetical Protein possibly ftsH- associated [Strawberry lethal yellows phytoplasma (CPA) str. NZSb11]